jgi:Fe-S-cluster-containing hydrogenase component 2/CRP-like cAMP-binding protein
MPPPKEKAPMARPPIDLAALSPRLAASPAPGDQRLVNSELQSLSIFGKLTKKIDFREFPGATFLWHGIPGRVLFVQGDPGATAFYVLTAEDVLALRRRQFERRQKAAAAIFDASTAEAAPPEEPPASSSEELRLIADEIARLETLAQDKSRPLGSALAVHVIPVEQQGLGAKTGWWQALIDRLARSADVITKQQRYIPIDAPVAIDIKGRCGSLYPGDLFGEMSCMNRAPRSATVIVENECYILEMARSVFESLHGDAQLQKQLDEKYRERLLGSFLERLSIFEGVPKELIEPLRNVAELETYPAGSVVFEQDDVADAVYIIRSGLAKVIENVGAKLRERDFANHHWTALQHELASSGSGAALVGLVRTALPAELQSALGDGGKGALSAADRDKILQALNAFICQDSVAAQFGKTTQDAAQTVGSREFERLCANFPPKIDEWSDMERRLFYRHMLESACPEGIPKRSACYGPMRTLAYRGQGEVIGEIGVIMNRPRLATCAAYDHPDGRVKMQVPDSRSGAVPSRLELVKIRRDAFLDVVQRSPQLKVRLDQIVQSVAPPVEAAAKPTAGDGWSLRNLPEYEDLGLVQGQRLMVIDLDRCTRCGECVKACVQAHGDGHTRLFLDGPRFGDYLLPISCRKCLDPVCMIGCPVGSIHRGDNGEIRIRDWCIGCSLCEKQCPYGSIQMSGVEGELELPQRLLDMLEDEVVAMKVKRKAVVCDLCSSTKLKQEACVYACPHDAALRVNGMFFSFEQRS